MKKMGVDDIDIVNMLSIMVIAFKSRKIAWATFQFFVLPLSTVPSTVAQTHTKKRVLEYASRQSLCSLLFSADGEIAPQLRNRICN